MRIMLLYPTWTCTYGIFSHFARRAGMWPPLNLAYLAAIAQKNGHTVRIIDGEAERVSPPKMISQTSHFKPDIIGITATTPFYHIAVELARGLKQDNNATPIIIGGPHITILKEKAFSNYFDYAFIGESDRSWEIFLKHYEEGKDISNIKGLFYRKSGGFVFTGMPDVIDDIDSIPFPARHLLKIERYKQGTLHGRKNFTSIMTSRGCPFKCIFCSTEVFGYRLRRRSLQSVIDEIKSVISSFSIRHFYIADDTLTLDRNYMLEFCARLEKENISITFEGGTRANCVDEELMSAMAKNGLIRLAFGLESVDAHIRKIIKKEIPLESYAKANKLANKYGVETVNSTILGLPGETRLTAERTLTYLRNAREIKQAHFSIATPYPGTELYEMAKRGDHGLKLLSEDFSKYRRYGSPVIEVNDLTSKDLLELQNDGFLRIYSAPWRLIPMLRKHGLIGGLLTFSRVLRKYKRKVLAAIKNGKKN